MIVEVLRMVGIQTFWMCCSGQRSAGSYIDERTIPSHRGRWVRQTRQAIGGKAYALMDWNYLARRNIDSTVYFHIYYHPGKGKWIPS